MTPLKAFYPAALFPGSANIGRPEDTSWMGQQRQPANHRCPSPLSAGDVPPAMRSQSLQCHQQRSAPFPQLVLPPAVGEQAQEHLCQIQPDAEQLFPAGSQDHQQAVQDDSVLPLKSWYNPGTIMMPIASSLLKVRKIWILAVHVTLILFRYMTEATGTETESCNVVMYCLVATLNVHMSTLAVAPC